MLRLFVGMCQACKMQNAGNYPQAARPFWAKTPKLLVDSAALHGTRVKAFSDSHELEKLD